MSEEIPDKYIEAFGEELAKEFYLLKTDLFVLRLDWRTYQGLFGTNRERVDLLNSVSGSVSSTIERVLFESVLLRLRRFIDKGSKKRRRLPLSLELLRKIATDQNAIDLHRLLVDCKKKCAFAKNWSDKRIAHSDYQYRIGNEKLLPASRQKVNEAIDSIAAVIKLIGSNLLDTHYVTHPIADLRDETVFLRVLYEGKRIVDEKPDIAKRLIEEGRFQEASSVHDYPEWLKRQPDQHD